MRYLTAMLVLFSAACGPAMEPGNNSDPGQACDFDVLDESCCSDPAYEARHMDLCLREGYIEHKSKVDDKADDLNSARVKPEVGDVLRGCNRPADELVHVCSNDATPENSCRWGSFREFPEYSGSRYEVQCICADTERGFQRLKNGHC